MKYTLLILLTFSVSQIYAYEEEYVQWVSYTGSIPPNAILVTVDDKFNQVYVGRAHLSIGDAKGYVPGAIVRGGNSMDVIFLERQYSVNSNMEILTKVGNARVEWQLMSHEQFPSILTSRIYHPVRSGWERVGDSLNRTTYLGRGMFDSTHRVGKIYSTAPYGLRSNVLYYPVNVQIESTATYRTLLYYF